MLLLLPMLLLLLLLLLLLAFLIVISITSPLLSSIHDAPRNLLLFEVLARPPWQVLLGAGIWVEFISFAFALLSCLKH